MVDPKTSVRRGDGKVVKGLIPVAHSDEGCRTGATQTGKKHQRQRKHEILIIIESSQHYTLLYAACAPRFAASTRHQWLLLLYVVLLVETVRWHSDISGKLAWPMPLLCTSITAQGIGSASQVMRITYETRTSKKLLPLHRRADNLSIY